MPSSPTRVDTRIFRFFEESEELIGEVDATGAILRLGAGKPRPIGRADDQGRIYRTTAHGEREAGAVSIDGAIHSSGLFEGGDLGWVDAQGVVVRAGLIFGEEEVGRVEGPQPHAAAGALLLLFLPDDAEAARDAERE